MIVSITRLHLRGIHTLPTFTWMTVCSHFQIRKTKGLEHISYQKEGVLTYWTMSIWHSPEDMKAFRNHGAHFRAMKHSRQLADELQYIQFSTTTKTLSWDECKERLHQKYRSKVL
ncbi:DUF3291 domain-containing protein [Shouchella lehensis]|uniref:DUF3291 domain-containing protein n=1 Tax=Shouchella lehensis TaxID=300825 RepID=A0A4Y7WLR3_9BACI|nr:DUF3291 domain-containing protein [Shouchella lehensis]MBG9783189.1 hypothetical protein [Shouchella lehensis]RQW22617.1 DUF3291 domain-containing protein [Bacillus sp. C1-1]TES49442.1 DUF3291 domain-containing protein [Shouchella lehensis]